MAKRQMHIAALVLLAFLAGLCTGTAWKGDGPHQRDEERALDTKARACEPQPAADCPRAPDPVAVAPLATEDRDFDLLSAIAAVLSDFWSGQPLEVVDVVTDIMSNRELASVLTNLTDLTDEDLAEIDDIHAFSDRLTSIAAEGLLTDLPEVDDDGVERLEFLTSDSDVPQDVFSTSEYKILAEYPTPPDGPRRVLIKWIQEDPYRLLQFRRRTIDPSSEYLTVANVRSGSWAEGQYRLQIFALNDTVDLLAEGRFTVVDDGQPFEGSGTSYSDE